ncbi:ASKHA domain-containing protein [Emergencia sp.]|uniref:ASKHA domain-containing protein n=1 Tax=Emergencia sp. TaxID=1926557 RepID=UPI003AF01918
MKITFLPQNITWEAITGETILQAAVKAGVNIDGNCAGSGTCGKCKVKIIEGDLSQCDDHHHKLTEAEIEAGYRLACCHQVTEGMVIEMPESETTASRKKKLIHLPEGFVPKAAVTKRCINVPAASIQNQNSDEARIKAALGMEELQFSLETLLKLPEIAKNAEEITVTIRDGQVIDAECGNTEKDNYGVAVDIGTTTVVIMLWNAASGEMMDIFAATNPQGAYGADVISRITYVMEKEGNLETIHQTIIDCINKAVKGFEENEGIRPEHIYQMAVVGNTTMSHIFLGVNPAQLALAPFTPVFTAPVDMAAKELHLTICPDAEVHVAANIAGHVGSDITAGIITTDLMQCDKGHLFIDIGTNGEIVLTGNGRAVACSTAAGPAFEGSSIKQGMRAARGAIERVDIFESGVEIETIGDVSPIGICGSGIIDAVGEMIRVGIVDKSGRLLSREKLAKKGLSENILNHIKEGEKANDFVLYFSEDGKSDVVITQKDVREVQLAKAAISAGITIMMKEIGVEEAQIAKISIAGAFGNYIRNISAMNIGLLPKIAEEKIVSLGNSAGIGASMILLSSDSKEEARKVAREIEHIELAARSDFQDQYMMAMMF